jgi:hypothetical protein
MEKQAYKGIIWYILKKDWWAFVREVMTFGFQVKFVQMFTITITVYWIEFSIQKTAIQMFAEDCAVKFVG